MKKHLLTLLAISLTIATTIQAQIPTNGLVAYYPFSGNANDASGNGNNGTNNGATLTTDRFGNANSAYNFDGKSNYISINEKPILDLSDSLTISIWHYDRVQNLDPINKVYYGSLISKVQNNTSNGYWIDAFQCATNNQTKNNISLGSNGWSVNNCNNSQTWQNLVLTFKSGKYQVYVNGVLLDSNTIASNKIPVNSLPLIIGFMSGATSNRYYNGIIDDIRFYNRVLNSADVNAIYHEGGYATNGIPTNGLVAWYPFTGNTLDSSGNGNNGTNNGATLTTDRFGKANSAYSFNGSTSYIRCLKSGPIGAASRSISVWINSTDSSTDGSVVSYGNNDISSQDFRVRHANTNCHGVSCTSNGAEKVGISNYSSDWKHYVIIYDSAKSSNLGSVSIFENGKLISSYCISGNSSILNTGNGNPITIGCYHWLQYSGNLNFFKGKLDDIRVYNRTLDSAEVQALYHEGGYDTATSSIPSNGLIAWYPFTGNTLDSSGNGNHGTNNGATLTKDRFGKANCAYDFNGKSYIIVPFNNIFNVSKSSFTLSCWAFKNDNADFGHLITRNDYINNTSGLSSYNLRYEHGKIAFYTSSTRLQNGNSLGWGSLLSDSISGLNNWNHILAVYDSINKVQKLFVNGKLVIQTVLNSTPISYNNNGNVYFGVENPTAPLASGPLYLNGKLDDIRIYNRALDSIEVKALYHEGGYNGTTLPVILSNFAASRNGNNVMLNWLTATELNTNHFIIQHGIDGNSFTNIGTINAIGSGVNNYQFTDKNPVNGTNYYRLQSVDKDGTISYSKIVSVQFANGNRYSIYPNPVKNTLTISGEHVSKVQILDNMGRIVSSQSLQDATNPSLSVSNLPNGVYHARIQTTDNKTNSIGFIKQ